MNNYDIAERLKYFFEEALKGVFIDSHNRTDIYNTNSDSITIPRIETHKVSYVDSTKSREFLNQLVSEIVDLVKDEIREQVIQEYKEAEGIKE